MLGDKYNFNAICALNKKENDILENFKRSVDFYRNIVRNLAKTPCGDNISEDDINSILSDIAEALFCKSWDITWGKIISFFVYVGEITLVSKKLSATSLDAIFQFFSRLVAQKVEYWVQNHGDWENMPLNRILDKNLASKPFWAPITISMTDSFDCWVGSAQSLTEKKVQNSSTCVD